MAKVDGPLFSLEARGKVGDAVVYFPWKGRHVVRQWLKPTNPSSTLQGYARAALKVISKAIAKIQNTSDGDAVDSTLYGYYTDDVPAGRNWNAHAAKGFLDQLKSGGELKTSSFDDLIAEYSSSLDTAADTAFSTEASDLGIIDFAFNYGYTDDIEAGFQLYAMAKGAYEQSIYASAPYDTDPVSWAESDVTDFAADFTT